MTGIALLHKPHGMRSFEVIRRLKKEHKGVKLGHGGTLDEFAEGLLLILIGSATSLYEQCTGLAKTYEAQIILGKQTDTLDPLGTVVQQAPVPDHRSIEKAIGELQGDIMQRPPAYSAIHINGKRAWQRVRQGESVELPPRKVNIQVYDHLYHQGRLSLRMQLSRGGYVRSYARDLAELAGSCGYVDKLRRTRIGPFRLEEASFIDTPLGKETIIPILTLCSRLGVPVAVLDREGKERITQGKELYPEHFGGFPEDVKERIIVTEEEDYILWVRSHQRRVRYRILSTLS